MFDGGFGEEGHHAIVSNKATAFKIKRYTKQQKTNVMAIRPKKDVPGSFPLFLSGSFSLFLLFLLCVPASLPVAGRSEGSASSFSSAMKFICLSLLASEGVSR